MKYTPYSYSKIGCFKECPHKFELKYIKKIKIPPKDPRFFEKGTFYHWVLEHYPNVKPEDFQFKHSTEEEQIKYVATIKSFIEDDKVRALLTQKKLSNEFEFKFDESINVEVEKTKWNSALYGYIDYVGMMDKNTYLIIDWKSKKHINFPNNVDQLEMYATWIFQARPKVDKILAFFYYIEPAEDGKQYELHTLERVKDLDRMKENIINNINTIEQINSFEKKVTQKCSRCDYFDKCKPFNVKVK